MNHVILISKIRILSLRNVWWPENLRSDIDPFKTALSLWGQTTGIIQIASLKEKIVLVKHFSLTAKDVIDYNFDLIYHALKT